jgi:hypothetical protein
VRDRPFGLAALTATSVWTDPAFSAPTQVGALPGLVVSGPLAVSRTSYDSNVRVGYVLSPVVGDPGHSNDVSVRSEHGWPERNAVRMCIGEMTLN